MDSSPDSSAPKPTRIAPIPTLDTQFFWDAADRSSVRRPAVR
jgi:hypothetical protein